MGNEVIDAFLPLMGAEAFAVYGYLKRIKFTNPELRHTVRDIGPHTKRSASTVSRSLEILQHLKLVELIRFGGNKASECKLLDSKKAALSLGAIYDSKTISWSLPRDKAKRLGHEIATICERQQGRPVRRIEGASENDCENRHLYVSQRNASVSPEKRQRATRETQAGTHLIRKKERIEEALTCSPSPSDGGEAEKGKDSSDEYEPEGLLELARAKFTGVMNDLGDDLFDTNRPPVPHLANGFADWEEFGFNSLAVEAAKWRGETLELCLSARDPAAVRRGLEKYHRKWNASLRKWFACEVKVELREASDGHEPQSRRKGYGE